MPDPLFPPTPHPDELARVGLLIDHARHAVAVSAALAQAGRPVDLNGFDDLIGRVCAQALDLDPALGPALIPKLRPLQAGIDALGQALTATPLRQKAAPCPSTLKRC